jgi:non-heme chloroperoxidase
MQYLDPCIDQRGLKKILFRFLASALLTGQVGLAQQSIAWHDPSKHQVQLITVEDGVRLEVLDWGGSGRAVVLLAGLGFTAHVFDGFAEKLTDSYHVYGITRRGYGASSQPASGYTEQRRAEDDLRVFDALKLVAPVVAGHSVAGDELSQLGVGHHDRIGGLVYLDALNDASDDYTDHDALCSKLPEAIQKAPTPSPSDLKSFSAYRNWRLRTQGIPIPESELRNDFVENPDGSVAGHKVPERVSSAIMAGQGGMIIRRFALRYWHSSDIRNFPSTRYKKTT